jgi:hypothetical protein
LTATSKKAKHEKGDPKTTADPKAASVKPKKAATTSAKPHHTTFSLEGISDLIENLSLETCVDLTRRLLTSISSLPKGAARPRAVLKTVILLVAEYGSTP